MKKAYKKVEQGLIEEILTEDYPAGTPLESERELAIKYGVSRATVREALQQLTQAGWITVNQRQNTRVGDFWRNGTLDILSSAARTTNQFPLEMAAQLLEVRVELAPGYTRKAIENDSSQVISCLARVRKLNDTSSSVAKFDWELNQTLAILSGNRFYPLLLNSFAKLYFKLRGQFFASEEFRAMARKYYKELMHAAIDEDADEAEHITRAAMQLRLQVFRHQVKLQAAAGG